MRYVARSKSLETFLISPSGVANAASECRVGVVEEIDWHMRDVVHFRIGERATDGHSSWFVAVVVPLEGQPGTDGQLCCSVLA